MSSVIRFVTFAILAAPLWGQQGSAVPTNLVDERSPSCSRADSDGQSESRTKIFITQISFPEPSTLPKSIQEEIAASIKRLTHGSTEEGVVGEAEEMARRGWQDQGYFKVRVQGEARTLTSNAILQRLALTIRVDEGKQYRLSQIQFKNNHAITNNQALRSLFPVAGGDIFGRSKIAAGLENLRKAYGEFGYANEIAVPATYFDEEHSTIFLEIDIDEGRQFFIGGIEILGLDDAVRAQLLNNALIGVGQVYNARLIEMFRTQHASMFPECACRGQQQLRLDESRGLAVLTFDARPCSSNE